MPRTAIVEAVAVQVGVEGAVCYQEVVELEAVVEVEVVVEAARASQTVPMLSE